MTDEGLHWTKGVAAADLRTSSVLNGTTREETQEAQGSPNIYLKLIKMKAFALIYVYLVSSLYA